MEKRDISLIISWLKDRELFFLNLNKFLSDREKKAMLLSQLSLNQIFFSPQQIIMAENNSGRMIGFFQLSQIDWKDRNLVLEKYFSSGTSENEALNATKVMLDYAFREMNMHKIMMFVPSFQKAIILSFEKNDHKPEAVLRKHIFQKGEYHDLYVFSIFTPSEK